MLFGLGIEIPFAREALVLAAMAVASAAAAACLLAKRAAHELGGPFVGVSSAAGVASSATESSVFRLSLSASTETSTFFSPKNTTTSSLLAVASTEAAGVIGVSFAERGCAGLSGFKGSIGLMGTTGMIAPFVVVLLWLCEVGAIVAVVVEDDGVVGLVELTSEGGADVDGVRGSGCSG